jgi:hypothetical protein
VKSRASLVAAGAFEAVVLVVLEAGGAVVLDGVVLLVVLEVVLLVVVVAVSVFEQAIVATTIRVKIQINALFFISRAFIIYPSEE